MVDSPPPALLNPLARLKRLAGCRCWPPLLLLVLPLLLFRQGLGTGTPPFGGDVLVLNYPLLALVKRQMLAGLLPLWNAWAGGGYPLVPFSSLVAYPLIWPLRLLDTRDAITLLDITQFAIAGLGVYALGTVTGTGRAGRLIGAMSFMLSGFMIGHLYAGHLLELGVIAWMPWVFLAAHRLLDQPSPRRALWLGLAAGLQVLGNGLGFLVFTIYPVAALLLTGALVEWRRAGRTHGGRGAAWAPIRRLLAACALAAVVALGLSAVIVLPFAQSLAWSIRAGGLDYGGASAVSLLPAALLMLFSPNAVGTGPDNSYWLDQFSLHNGYWHEFALYMGLLPLLAAAAACLYCRRTPAVRFYAWLALAGLVLALGKYTPIYGLAFHLPLLSLVRVPARWLLASTLAVSVLAGPGFDWLLARRAGVGALWRGLRLPLLLAAGLILVLVAGLQVEYMLSGHIDLQPKLLAATVPAGGRLLLFAAVLALILACGAERLIRPSAVAGLLVAFTLLDLWTAASGSVLFADPTAYYQPPAAGIVARTDDAYRLLALPNRAVPYRQGMIDGSLYDAEDFAPVTIRDYWTLTHPYALNKTGGHSVSNADARDLITCYDQRFAGLLGISTVLTSAPYQPCPLAPGPTSLVLQSALVSQHWALPNGTSWNPLWYQSITYVYRNTAALPRALLLPARQARTLPGEAAQLAAVLAPGFDGRRTILYDPATKSAPLGLGGLQAALADRLRPAPAPLPRDLPIGQARVIADNGNSVQVAVRAGRPSFLLLDDTYYPGWQAWVDGKPAAIHRADYLLRAVAMPAGTHRVTFAYAPLSYLAGLIATGATALLTAGGLWISRRRPSPRPGGRRRAEGLYSRHGDS